MMSLTRIYADELPIASVQVSVICFDQVRTWADFFHTRAFVSWSFGVYWLKTYWLSNLKLWQWSCALVVSCFGLLPLTLNVVMYTFDNFRFE